jgi:VWFA-related protein
MKAMLVLFLFVSPAFAQQNTVPPVLPAASPSPASGDKDRRVTLDIVVTDKSGKPVAGLQQQDFTVLGDKVPLKILSFHPVETATPDAPVEVILLVDAVNTSFEAVATARQEIVKFLRQNGGRLPLPVSTVLFSDSGVKQSDATSDGNALIAFLDKNENALRTVSRAAGGYGAIELLQLSLQTLNSLAESEAQIPGRKMLIWIGPGWPMLSGPGVRVSPTDQQGIFKDIVGLSTELRQGDITLYSVDPLGTSDAAGFRTFRYRDFLKGVKTANQTQAGNLALQVLAYQSGGRVFNSSNDIAGEIASCTLDANSFYVLSFDSPPPDGPIEYYGLEVKIGKPGRTARTWTGYYAQQ